MRRMVTADALPIAWFGILGSSVMFDHQSFLPIFMRLSRGIHHAYTRRQNGLPILASSRHGALGTGSRKP
jgi:hypothetical protein